MVIPKWLSYSNNMDINKGNNMPINYNNWDQLESEYYKHHDPYDCEDKELDYDSIEVDDIDINDYPDFSDAYISSARWSDGEYLTDQELDDLNEDRDLVYEYVLKTIY